MGGVASYGVSTYIFWNQGNQETIAYIAIASIVGSLFPDVDSDTSKTIRYFFYSLTGLTLLLTSNYFYLNGVNLKKSMIILFVIPFLIMFLIKPLFMKLTVHRGIFHTIPMGLTISLLTMYIPFTTYKFIIFTSFMLGFLTHLLLDEIYATINISGLKIKPKKSFGTAMKWFAPYLPANIALNSILAILIFDNSDLLYSGFQNIF